MVEGMRVKWKIKNYAQFSFIEFIIEKGLLKPEDIREVKLPGGLESRRHLGLIISGRGPVWLYAYLVHEAHPFGWVATYDPRLEGGVVVMNHLPDGPTVGDLIKIPSSQ